MINKITGDILSLKSGVIVHGCNSHGVMGAGLALQIKEKYPENFQKYHQAITNVKIQEKLGRCIITEPSHGLLLCNMITQEDYGRSSNKSSKTVTEKIHS